MKRKKKRQLDGQFMAVGKAKKGTHPEQLRLREPDALTFFFFVKNRKKIRWWQQREIEPEPRWTPSQRRVLQQKPFFFFVKPTSYSFVLFHFIFIILKKKEKQMEEIPPTWVLSHRNNSFHFLSHSVYVISSTKKTTLVEFALKFRMLPKILPLTIRLGYYVQ